MNTFNQARQKEIDYHEKFYSETELFQPGSWLSRPVKIVMETLERFDLSHLRVLDLGCGVGRNSIPIAQKVKEYNGKVTCVDLLPSALELLSSYAGKYGVSGVLESQAVDVEDFQIHKNTYHYIVACSCLEHVKSEEAFKSKLKQMQVGTKEGGIHCILMSTDVKEIEAHTGIEHKGLIELNLSTERAFSILKALYGEWDLLAENQSRQEIRESKGDEEIIFSSNWITFVARKKQGTRGEP